MTRTVNVVLVVLVALTLAAAVSADSSNPSSQQAATPQLSLKEGRAVPGTVWYQGFLAGVDTGAPINDTVEIVAELFDTAVDGTGLWGPETHSGISVVEGWFNIELGSIESPLPDFATPPYYLQLTIDGGPFDSRMKLASAPTAIRASETDGGGGGGIGDGTSNYIGVVGDGYAISDGMSFGVFASATAGSTSYGIYADAWGADYTDWAGYFDGDVHSTGTITSAKSGFEIDHPSDPMNAYLRHAYVASPEMKTVTDGTAVLDATGSATVTLPDWFEALNTEVRYQLTPIGAAAPNLHIGSELSGGAFTIAGGTPGMKVCWLVTGIRRDRAALADPVTVESAKPFNERGKYVSPAAFGATKEMGIGHREIKRPPRER